MKKVRLPLMTAAVALVFAAFSCTKSECHECHYEDANDNEVELGEYCDEDLENLEANGYLDNNGDLHEVHCHEH